MGDQLDRAGTPYVQFQGVEVTYNGLVTALRGVSLDIRRGEFVFLCGPTGSGKSTFLKALSLQVRPSNGCVLLDGVDLGTVEPGEVSEIRRRMGVVPQDFGLLPKKRVWENLGYAMRACGRTRREVRQLVPGILERVHVLHKADAFPGELSGGEQQRVAIGRAIINNPPLLLADEPTGNLDPDHSAEVMDLLLELNLRGTTVLVATHDMPIVEQVARRVVLFEHGGIVADSHASQASVRGEAADEQVTEAEEALEIADA
ncbi:MAG: cell division ATP-binding protein FtsE [Fimbriimonadaceae bacterium]